MPTFVLLLKQAVHKQRKPSVMKGFTKRWLLSLGMSAFVLTGCGSPEVPTPPDPPAEEDPITHVTVPGAYGVKGGDKIVLPSSQTSVLNYGKSFSYRILETSTLTVVSLSGLPAGLKVGDSISLYYRLARGGRTLESEMYENVEILMITDKMAWLKKSDEIFFVIELL